MKLLKSRTYIRSLFYETNRCLHVFSSSILRTKTTSIVKGALAPLSKEHLIESLKSNQFALLQMEVVMKMKTLLANV